MFKTAIAALPALLILAAPPAASDRAWQVGNDSMHLYYSDLDMNSAAGRAALLARVERAAARLCRDRGDPRECAALTVAQTLELPSASALRVAAAERGGTRLAAR